MKKLGLLLVVFAFATFTNTVFAQETATEVVEEAQEAVEVSADELPEAVKNTLKASFEGYTVSKAHKVGANYVAHLDKEGAASLKVTFDENGTVVSQEEVK